MSERSGRGQGQQTKAGVVEQSRREEGIVRPSEAPVHDEHPADWGWHAESGRFGRIVGWLTVLSLLALIFGNHEGQVENLWILGFALTLVVMLLWDVRRRKNAWRSR